MKNITRSIFFASFCLIFILSVKNSNAQKVSPIEDIIPEYVEGTSALLGEGSIWDYDKSVLYWIDIDGEKFWTFDPLTRKHTEYELGSKVGCLVPETINSVVVALQDGVYRKYLDSGKLEFISRPASLKSEERFNDGKCDAQGRLWVGTMRLEGKRGDSHLYKMDKKGTFSEMINNVSISNGIVWSIDNKKMYYIDTPTRKVMEYSFNLKKGTISDPRVAVQIPEGIGGPDGMTIDNEGMIWVAIWGGSSVCRFDPRTGELLARVKLPVKNVTSCAFGGKNLDILFITTAKGEEGENEGLPSGGLYMAIPGVKGIKANSIHLD